MKGRFDTVFIYKCRNGSIADAAAQRSLALCLLQRLTRLFFAMAPVFAQHNRHCFICHIRINVCMVNVPFILLIL
jgi:hypothetical protein